MNAQQIALWADQLRGLSTVGLQHAGNVYDTERYRAIQALSMQMLAAAGDLDDAELEPLRAHLAQSASPRCAGGGAVIDDAGRILLQQRADNGMWGMPGGGLEVGETPAEGAVREVLEETGVTVRPTALVGIFDSRLCGTASLQHLYHILFLCVPVEGEPSADTCSHANEVLDVGWFPEDGLPDEICPGHGVRIPAAYRAWHRETPTFFDR